MFLRSYFIVFFAFFGLREPCPISFQIFMALFFCTEASLLVAVVLLEQDTTAVETFLQQLAVFVALLVLVVAVGRHGVKGIREKKRISGLWWIVRKKTCHIQCIALPTALSVHVL